MLSGGFGKNSKLNPGKRLRMKSSWRPTNDSCVLLILAAVVPLVHLALAPRITPTGPAHQLPRKGRSPGRGWGAVGGSGGGPGTCGGLRPFLCSSAFLPVRHGQGNLSGVKPLPGASQATARGCFLKGLCPPPPTPRQQPRTAGCSLPKWLPDAHSVADHSAQGRSSLFIQTEAQTPSLLPTANPSCVLKGL